MANAHTAKNPDKELANLANLDRPSLIARWQELYGTAPPVSMSQIFLVKGIAYRLQEKAFGGLRPATKRLLKKGDTDKNVSLPATTVKAGTKLLREWHGTIHEVIVQHANVLYNGKTYRSLTEVAEVITGLHRSGPQFFGLKEKRKKKHDTK